MPKEIELKIITNQSSAIAGIKQLASESQNLWDGNAKAVKREIGLIADVEKGLDKLKEAQRNAMSVEAIAKYNQKIGEAKARLQEYNEAGVKANKDIEKSGTSLLSSIGKWVAGFAASGAALKVFEGIIKSTNSTAHAFETVIAQAKTGVDYFFKAVASGDWTNFRQGFVDAMNGARKFVDDMENIQNRRNEQEIKSADISKQIAKLRADTFDKGVENNDKLIESQKQIIELEKQDYAIQAKLAADTYQTALDKAALDNRIDKDKLDYLIKEFTANEEILKVGEKYNTLQVQLNSARKVQNNTSRVIEIKKEIEALGSGAVVAGELAKQYGKVPEELKKSLASLKANQIALEGQAQIGSRRDENLLALALNKKETQEAQSSKKIADDKLATEKKYLEMSQKLIDDYDKSNIDSLTGIEKLKAQRDFALKQIAEFRADLAKLGTVTAEQDVIFSKLGENVWKAYMEGLKKQAKLTPEQQSTISKLLEESMTPLAGLQKSFINTTPASGPDFSIWKMLGIDPESDDGKEAIKALKEAADVITKTIDDIFNKRVEDAQRTRELAQSRLDESQQELQTEIQLYEAGYASNVAAKQKEIELLKAKRDAALKDEEKAIKAQRAFDSISQLSSLITASANIFKSLSKLGPIGVAIAIGTIGAMFTAFAITKATAAKATKLASGGHGVVSGRLHSEGGESFLDHVEVEQGERWGVLSRSASRKYGKQFGTIVDSFNKDSLKLGKGVNINNILVQNDGPNQRLDEVNSNLKQIRSKEEIMQVGNVTIIRKGNTVRTIKR